MQLTLDKVYSARNHSFMVYGLILSFIVITNKCLPETVLYCMHIGNNYCKS